MIFMPSFGGHPDVRLVCNEKTTLNGHQNQAVCHKKYLTMI